MEATRKGNHSGVVAASLGAVVDRVAEGAHQAVDRAAGAASAAAKAVDRNSGRLLAVQERYLDGCRERVREKPLAAVGIALAAGIVLSFLLIRR